MNAKARLQQTAVAVAAAVAFATGWEGPAVETPQAVQSIAAAVTAAPAPAAPEPVAAETAGWDLPNLEHERVDYWVTRFTTDKRDDFAVFLQRMTKYEPMISDKLAERGMPQDLLYLSLIESGFQPRAYSPAGAPVPGDVMNSRRPSGRVTSRPLAAFEPLRCR